MKREESKNILRTSNFFTELISFLAFSTVRRYITPFCNNEYINTSSLTSRVADMGICFFKRRSIKIIRLKKEIVLSVFHYFFDLSIYRGGSSNLLMGILLSFVLFQCKALLFIQPTNNFSLMRSFSVCCFAYSLKCNNGQKKLSHITN